MRFLAGLQCINAFWLDDDTGDCILAGPAGAWTLDARGRVVGSETGHPVCRLDDLVVLLRNSLAGQGQFLCAITPRTENLRRTQEFLAASAARPVRSGERDAWLQEFRNTLGKQQIEVQGVDPDTRVARVLVEADHHMKLVGLGLVPSAGDLVDYLSALAESVDNEPVQLGVLRWWFTLQERCVHRAEGGAAYILRDRVVCLLSENELLARHGQRVPTGRADPMNAQFARSFTANYRALSQRYPVYAELDNLFRLAIVAAVLREEDLLGGADWSLESWLDDRSYPIPRARIRREVLSVVNFLELNRRHFLAAVSGGVSFRREQLLARGFDTKPIAGDRTARKLQAASPAAADVWWWD